MRVIERDGALPVLIITELLTNASTSVTIIVEHLAPEAIAKDIPHRLEAPAAGGGAGGHRRRSRRSAAGAAPVPEAGRGPVMSDRARVLVRAAIVLVIVGVLLVLLIAALFAYADYE